ncbi:MAG: DUF916 domain-containing protein [Candidatus Moranbacteria bacterium]|nr:DUF916 domain-containing protein [Candidatus Moranbacteria bacterium]
MKVFNFVKLNNVVFILIFFRIFNFSQVRAEDGVPERGLQISPTKFDLELKPGMVEERVVNVKNYNKDSSHNIEVELEDFFIKDDGSSQPQYLDKNKRKDFKVYDVANWIEVEEKFTLSPNEARDILVKITVPEDVPTGSYYGAIVFKTIANSEKDKKNNQSTLDEYYGARIPLFNAVRGKEEIKLEGELLRFFSEYKIFFGLPISRDFSFTENLFKWGGSANLVTHVKNTGNLHYKVKGKIDVYKFGRHYKTIEIKEQMIYPDRVRIYNNQFNYRWWDFGFYSAKVELDSTEHNIHLKTESRSWIIFPWKTFLAVVLFLTANYFERKIKRRKNSN